MLKTIIAAGVVSVVILGEVLAAYLLLGDGRRSSHDASGQRAAGGESDSDEGGKHRADPTAEVDLGKFSIVVYKADGGGTMRINFHLIGTVPESRKEEFDQLLSKCQHRLRDQVIGEVQRCQSGELTEPGLTLIKRKILERSNDLFGQPLLRTVILSDYSLVEH